MSLELTHNLLVTVERPGVVMSIMYVFLEQFRVGVLGFTKSTLECLPAMLPHMAGKLGRTRELHFTNIT